MSGKGVFLCSKICKQCSGCLSSQPQYIEGRKGFSLNFTKCLCSFLSIFAFTFQSIRSRISLRYFRPIKRGEDTVLKDFEEDLIQKVNFVLEQNTTPGKPRGVYKALRKRTKKLRRNDLKSPWQRKLMNKVSSS